ncbi:MAG: UDP-N-acetylmuramate dehydrogenase [Pseudomonadota bacterium]
MMAMALDISAFTGLRGKLAAHVEMRKHTWFRTGGTAALVFRPADAADLRAFLKQLASDMPIMPMGAGSNLLVRDGGLDAAVIQLGRAFAEITFEDDVMCVGAGTADLAVAKAAHKAGRAGFEFLSGIPGTIGGAVTMNAGAYGADMADILVDATVMLRSGKEVTLTPENLAFSYRTASLPDEAIVLSVRLRGKPGDRDVIAARMQEIISAREDSQPIRSRTGGSTFKNPEGDLKAWQLIDAAGCRGLTHGKAQVSAQHCNFLINTGDASAADLEGLGEAVRRRVLETSGVSLSWEIKRVGRANIA